MHANWKHKNLFYANYFGNAVVWEFGITSTFMTFVLSLASICLQVWNSRTRDKFCVSNLSDPCSLLIQLSVSWGRGGGVQNKVHMDLFSLHCTHDNHSMQPVDSKKPMRPPTRKVTTFTSRRSDRTKKRDFLSQKNIQNVLFGHWASKYESGSFTFFIQTTNLLYRDSSPKHRHRFLTLM